MIRTGLIAAKLILLFIAIFLGLGLFYKRISRRKKWGLIGMTLLFAWMANSLASMTPPVKDAVVLAAGGGTLSEPGEIVFRGYTIDGKAYTCEDSLEIEEGKWFWSSGDYVWRDETDPRQPQGTTRAVTVSIPVGDERELNFLSTANTGAVEITVDDATWTVDTRSETESVLPVKLARSSARQRLHDAVRRLLVYAAGLSLLAGGAYGLLWAELHGAESVSARLGKRSGWIYALISAIAFAIMLSHAADTSLWLDGMIRLQGSQGGPAFAVHWCLTMIDASPPLFAVVGALWYRLIPYGERLLRLIVIVPTVLAIYLAGRSLERISGKYAGVLAALTIAFSTTVWESVAMDYGPYAFTLLFTTLSLYLHIRKNRENALKWKAAYSVSLLCLAMSHYFGMLACAAFFVMDAALMSRKKVPLRTVCQYFPAGGGSLTWLVCLYNTTLKYLTGSNLPAWYPIPKLIDIKNVVVLLCGNSTFVYMLTLFGAAYIASAWLLSRERRPFCWELFYQRALLGTVAGVFAALYVYGNYINRQNTMFQGRYFTILIPFLAGLFPIAFEGIGANMRRPDAGLLKKALTAFIGILLFVDCVSVHPSGYSGNPYRESADWLYTQTDTVFAPDTAIVMPVNIVSDAWSEYYISRKGRRDSLNVIHQYDFMDRVSAGEIYKRIYLSYIAEQPRENLQLYLNENYVLEQNLPELQMSVYVRKDG